MLFEAQVGLPPSRSPATQPLTLMSRGWRSEAFSGAAQPASAPGGAAQPTPPVVAIDVGDVASKRNDDQRVEGSEMYTAVEDGFWAFAVLFAAKFGLQNMHFISRTKVPAPCSPGPGRGMGREADPEHRLASDGNARGEHPFDA